MKPKSEMHVRLLAMPALTDDALEIMRDECREDQMRGSSVEVISEMAGRVCYDSFGRGRNSQDFHRHILESSHINIYTHCVFTFLVEGVSRNLSHELVRHHVGTAISQRSTRYCDESESVTVRHPQDKGFDNDDELWRSVYKGAVTTFTAHGMDRKTARGAAARYLPNGIETKFVWSANVTAMRHIIKMRLNEHADEEIRNFARVLLRVLRTHAPMTCSDLLDYEEVNL